MGVYRGPKLFKNFLSCQKQTQWNENTALVKRFVALEACFNVAIMLKSVKCSFIAILGDLLIELRRRYFAIMSSRNDGF